MLAGAPISVKQAMENNLDIPGATDAVWERQLRGQLRKRRKWKKTKAQLLKLQLEEAKSKLAPKKSKQMTQQPAVTSMTPMQPQAYYTPQPQPQLQPYPYTQTQPRFRGKGMNRGRGVPTERG